MKYIDIKYNDPSLNKRDPHNSTFDVVLYKSRSDLDTKRYLYKLSHAQVQALLDKYHPEMYSSMCNRISFRFKWRN